MTHARDRTFVMAIVVLLASPAWSQVDQARARQYFEEVCALSEKDAVDSGRQSEQTREREAQKRLAELRRSFVDGPVLTLPSGHSFSFKPEGTTPIPVVGTVYSTYRTTATGARSKAMSCSCPQIGRR